MLPYPRPRQLPASRGSKLGYYRASIACVGCRKSKTRCLLTPRREQDSCLNCRRKGQPCAFLTVDKKPPDWIWSKGRRRQTIESESASSSQLSVSRSFTDPRMVRDRASGSSADTQSNQPREQCNLAWDVDVPDFSSETRLPPNLGSHVDPQGWVNGNAESSISPDRVEKTDLDLTLPYYSGPSLSQGFEWGINITPLEYPYSCGQYQLQTGQIDPTFDPAALTPSTPCGSYGYYSQVSDTST
ncbi:uncharacterized protein Z519_06430 [Cladophialophora bantiana CBS 173.52]|uniref:Zn(2)-C6 fungal-type domain-containing protein n=1 Tax=Cladophialophora bantiana (strain ATCC 10958 / CBS 173.52 / CDC B-1940 / NIH 8579) TaxID=1442370 RepID=A0A0D2HH51_CLAB1|nr:uncharacterized protein Z519_06430 [Cladophialophora bantiana CBS 173.52]KIW92583.1 hypothetical protein Z519_06430 [Cladophialophora bantiana CBS 173.52]